VTPKPAANPRTYQNPNARVGSRAASIGRAALGALALVAGGGCVSVVAPASHLAPESRSHASGDRDDIWPAITAAMTQNEMAVTDVYYDPPDRRTYLIKSVRDEPVRLTLEGPGFGEGASIVGPFLDGAGGPTGEVRMTCQVGRFGDPEREHKLMRDVATRLRQLEGVGATKIRY